MHEQDEETADQMMARLREEADKEINPEADRERRDADNRRMMEEGVEAFTSLDGTIPVDAASMQGYGPGGPFLVDVPWFTVEDGELRRVIKRLPLGAFVYDSLIHVTDVIQKINPTLFMLALAWSRQRGKPDPDMAQIAKTWNGMIPPWSEIVVDGQVHRIQRPEITEDVVIENVGRVLQSQTLDEISALYEVVFIALGRFNQDLTFGDVKKHFDMAMLMRCLAIIMTINPRMSDRFFG